MHKQIAISVLLERVFLRIGSTETDAQLETELKRFLCPVLLKLASQTEGVRKKVKKKQYWCFELICLKSSYIDQIGTQVFFVGRAIGHSHLVMVV